MKKWMLLPLLALAGCAQIENYQQAVKVPAPDGLAGVWQSDGPQSALVSPQAQASLIISDAGDTLDCRQWQRVIAKPGKLVRIDDQLMNINRQLRMMPIDLDNGVLHYDGLSLKKVSAATTECQQALAESARSPQQAVIQNIEPTLMQNHFADRNTAQ
ncbi:lipoprotein YedD [Tatumella saanichensis]|uniref:lipoprotein YedD n=1 Tax=Tatumella saanichensis TaxID=480813 RepID=UPI0004A426A0|nr:lipoprotein YedD [Tatumella saanichensis]